MGYTTHIASEPFLRALELATRFVGRMPIADPSGRDVRCHEIARSTVWYLSKFQFGEQANGCKMKVVDGVYGIVDHSWILLSYANQHAILDVYAVGRLPMVQLCLVETPIFKFIEMFEEREPRNDIRGDVIYFLSQEAVRPDDRADPDFQET